MNPINPQQQNLVKRVQNVVNTTPGHVSCIIKEGKETLVEIHPNVRKKAASLIKIPILLTAFYLVDKGKLDLSKRYKINQIRKVGGAGVIQYLDSATELSLLDHLTLMIVVSDNMATNKVIDVLTMESIQQFCHEKELYKTTLLRKMMDNIASKSGLENNTSAIDMMTCMDILQDKRHFSVKSRMQMLEIIFGQQLQDKLPFYINEEDIKVANKTGELPGVEHDCAVFSFREKNLIVIVMIDGLVDNSAGKRAIQKIGWVVKSYLLETPLFRK
ncbi:serine hydrolase [Sutcliffiella rhizosphaerae]|uniref:Beta-lactamase class A catalytic domain-containing protein n=1 Tax=Sutcliffiella rhizosphaerae TaxID=2880967 RepID=A0ABM8YHB7_9BACI|nr:serine hydrolase [Sutcliffiella rhizosphaerae]CAG9619273.1 hypothetical protein BACCIP111883_00040 [Sutcliffiella rhizosphaerae]